MNPHLWALRCSSVAPITDRFVVEGALQVLGAAEARAALGIDPDHAELLVLPPGVARLQEAIDRAAAFTNWPRRRDLPARAGPLSHLRRVRAVRRLAAEPQTLERIHVGDYRSPLMRHLVNRANPAPGETWLLDDGMATLWVVEHRRRAQVHEPTDEASIVPRPLWHRLKRPAARVLGLDVREYAHLHFFTIYALATGPADTITTHAFTDLRSRFPRPQLIDTEAFLGSSLVEVGAMSEADYAALVRRAVEGAHSPVEYFPHHRESPEKVERLCRAVGARPSSRPGPVELTFLEAGQVPHRIGGVFSTALHTLHLLVPPETELYALEIDSETVRPYWRAQIDEVYHALTEHTGGRVLIQAAPPR